VHNFTRECQSHWRKNLLPYICYVATIPCEILRHKSNTFHTILALCTCLYRSHLGQPVSTKQTKHSRKSKAQNLCSKCPPFTRTHAFKRIRHCAIADGFGNSVQSWYVRSCTSWNQGLRSTLNGDYYRNAVLLNMLLLDIRSLFGDYYVFQQDGAQAHRARCRCAWSSSLHSLSSRSFNFQRSFNSRHGSTSGRPSVEAYPGCCSPPDSNLAN